MSPGSAYILYTLLTYSAYTWSLLYSTPLYFYPTLLYSTLPYPTIPYHTPYPAPTLYERATDPGSGTRNSHLATSLGFRYQPAPPPRGGGPRSTYVCNNPIPTSWLAWRSFSRIGRSKGAKALRKASGDRVVVKRESM